MELGHVHLRVRDVERAVGFYAGVLDLSVTERHERYAFLSAGERHHDLALQAVGPEATAPERGVGLYHVAFEVDTPDELAAVYDRLRERDAGVDAVDHGISRALYFDDPDGNGVEAYLDTREGDAERWRGHSEPFDPATLG